MKIMLSTAVALAVAVSMLMVAPVGAVTDGTIQVDFSPPNTNLAGGFTEYRISFHNDGLLLEGDHDHIDIMFPTGTVLPSQVDLEDNLEVFQGDSRAIALGLVADVPAMPVSVTVNRITDKWVGLTLDGAGQFIHECEWVAVFIPGVTNPTSCNYHLQVWTLNRGRVVSEVYTIHPAVTWVEVVDVDEPLADEEAEYTILFHNNAMLEGEVDFIDVVFPEGSDVATVVDDPIVLVGPADDELVPIDVANWAAVGTRTLRIYPEEDIDKCMLVMVIIDGVMNPGASNYRLQVGTSTHTPVSSEWYTIYALVRIELEEGKNLIALPYYPEYEAIEVVLKGLFDEAISDPDFEFAVWYWDAVDHEWLVYESETALDQIDRIQPSKSYWIKVSNAVDFCFRGVSYPGCVGPPQKWYYAEGWNMVGFASQTPMTAERYLRDARQSWPKYHNLAVLYIFGWGPMGWENVDWTDELMPGRGYIMAFLTGAYIIPPVPQMTVTGHFEEISSDTNTLPVASLHDVTLLTSVAGEVQEIHDWYGLNATRDNLGGSYVLLNDLGSTTPGYQELASPAANDGKGWDPIGLANPFLGTADDEFTGAFDGQGYEIRDLFVHRPYEDHVGLFGVVGAEAVIQNVGVVDFDVTGDFVVGGLAGWNWGTLNRCYAIGAVAGSGWGVGRSVGILVGSNAGIIGDCYATGGVTGGSDVGGLAGSNVGAISRSLSTGAVTGEEGVGGLVGSNALSGVVINSYSTGRVIGEQYVGGLVGWNYCATISQSYSTGTVTGNASVGGLVGANTELFSQLGTVSDSFWDTESSGQSSTAGDATGKTTAEMMDIATFTDTATAGLDLPWDIIDLPFGTTDPDYIWNIVDGRTYAFLSWEKMYLVAISTADLPEGQVGMEYEVTLQATGGTEPYTWGATGLPNGLTCSEDGVISGTPIGEVGEFTVTVTVYDAMANTHSRELPLTISCKLGDANMDGVVNAGDLTKVRRIFFGIDAPTPCADVNGDGVVNAGDLTAIRMIFFGLMQADG